MAGRIKSSVRSGRSSGWKMPQEAALLLLLIRGTRHEQRHTPTFCHLRIFVNDFQKIGSPFSHTLTKLKKIFFLFFKWNTKIESVDIDEDNGGLKKVSVSSYRPVPPSDATAAYCLALVSWSCTHRQLFIIHSLYPSFLAFFSYSSLSWILSRFHLHPPRVCIFREGSSLKETFLGSPWCSNSSSSRAVLPDLNYFH